MKLLFELKTAAEVVDALGGITQAGKLVGRSKQAMANSANRDGYLPPSTFLILQRELRRRGYTASPMLWRITPVAQARERA